MAKKRSVRLDQLLVQRGLFPSREQARRSIMAGLVVVEGYTGIKPGMRVPEDYRVQVKERPRYVSRGGEKLAAAFAHFPLNVMGKICADVGASTGGFTDVLLQSGAGRVYAIDVGYGQLAWQIRRDDRVVVMERVNARYLSHLPEVVDFVCIDVSFISLKQILPPVMGWISGDADIVALVKPQFEAGRKQVGKGGVVRDKDVHRQVLSGVITAANDQQLSLRGLISSPLLGPAGNIEFVAWFQPGGRAEQQFPDDLIDRAVEEAHSAS